MNDYFTPTEILDRNPEMRTVWNPQKIGWLLSLKLVSGYKTRNTALISETDVKNIFELVKKRLG